MLKFALLGFLNYRPMTGYELKQTMDSSTANFWHAKLSQIYTSLKALEHDGWVRSKIQPQSDRPDKRIYTITPIGRENLQKWLSDPTSEPTPHKDEFLLKFFFSGGTDRESTLASLRLQRSLHQQQAEFYRTETRQVIRQIVAQAPDLAGEALFWEATRRFGELFEETYVAWLDETIQALQGDA